MGEEGNVLLQKAPESEVGYLWGNSLPYITSYKIHCAK